MARNLRVGVQRGLRQSIGGGFGTGDIFTLSPASFDFSRTKTKDSRITFTRASSGTFVGADGLIKTTPVNLITNSQSIENWPQVRVTVSSDNAISPIGDQTADTVIESTDSNTHHVKRTVAVESGKTYTASVFVKAAGRTKLGFGFTSTNFPSATRGAFDLAAGTAVESYNTITNVGNGWYRLTATNTANGTGSAQINVDLQNDSGSSNYAGDGTSGVILWGGQVEEGSTATDYIRTTSTISGAPRFDHDPVTGESLGLLIEEARTNDITTDIGLTSSTSGVSLSEDSSVSKPDGTTGALKITATAGSSVHAAQRTSGATTTNHAFSVFVKKGNHRYIGLSQGGVSNNIHVIFDTDTKTITDDGAKNNGTFVSSGFEEYANGWFRIHMVGFTQGTTLRVFLAQNDSQNGMKNWSATGNEFAYAWGLQREDGDFPTSYIPTSGSAVTRAADVAEITGTNFSSFYNQSEGTVFVQSMISRVSSTATGIVSVNDSTNTGNRLVLFYRGSGATGATMRKSNSISLNVNPYGVLSANADIQQALAYKSGDTKAAGGGVLTSGVVTTNIPTTNRFQIGAFPSTGVPLSGHIKRLAYFPTRLADATLQSITF